MDERRHYELYVVFQPDLDEDQVEDRIDRVNSTITNHGGDIVEVVRRGKRRLAYPIDRHTFGIDVIYQAHMVGSAVEILERQFNLSEDVIRYLFVRREDLEKAARQATQERSSAKESAAPVESATAPTVDPTDQPQPIEEFPANQAEDAPATSATESEE